MTEKVHSEQPGLCRRGGVASRLALGTVQLGMNYGIANTHGQVSLSEAKMIIEHAKDKGLDTLDTATAYGDSELRLGEIGVQDWKIVSKLQALPDGCSDIYRWVKDSLKESLQRLKVKTLYGLLLHQPGQLLEQYGERLYCILQEMKQAGHVEKIGISIYDPSELDMLLHKYEFDIVQAPFNILDRRLLDSGWLYRLSQQNTEVHARSIFLQGLLLMINRNRPPQFNRFQSLWQQWDEWLENAKLSPLQACIRYALSFPEISKIIVGVDSLIHLQEILCAAEGPLPQVPSELYSGDNDLLNPTRWSTL